MTVPVEVAQAHKFAVLALPNSRGGGAPAALYDLGSGFAVSEGLPSNALETWKDDLGRFHQRELSDCQLFLWATSPSANPAVLDQENKNLQKRVLQLHLGLLLAVPNFSCSRITYLGGANADGTARVRTLTTYNPPWHTVGSPTTELTIARLKLAANLASAFEHHDNYRFDARMVRTIRTYREACESRYVDEKLHHFVRAAESFAGSWGWRQFVSRLGFFCTGRHKLALRQMYQTRSAVEHLQGPHANMAKGMGKEHRQLLLFARCHEAGALARFLLVEYLLNRKLWPHFRSNKRLAAFWSIAAHARARLWPARLHYPSVAKAFDPAAVKEAEANAD